MMKRIVFILAFIPALMFGQDLDVIPDVIGDDGIVVVRRDKEDEKILTSSSSETKRSDDSLRFFFGIFFSNLQSMLIFLSKFAAQSDFNFRFFSKFRLQS